MTTKQLISLETFGALKRAGVLALKRAELHKIDYFIIQREGITTHRDD